MHQAPLTLSTLSLLDNTKHRDPPCPCPPLSTCSCSSNPLPYTWMIVKLNKRGCLSRRPEIFFWEERTSKTGRVDLLGLSELKIVTSVNILGWAHLLLQNCGFPWRISTSSLQKERSSIFCGLSTFKRISEASYCLLYGWGVNWCD